MSHQDLGTAYENNKAYLIALCIRRGMTQYSAEEYIHNVCLRLLSKKTKSQYAASTLLCNWVKRGWQVSKHKDIETADAEVEVICNTTPEEIAMQKQDAKRINRAIGALPPHASALMRKQLAEDSDKQTSNLGFKKLREVEHLFNLVEPAANEIVWKEFSDAP